MVKPDTPQQRDLFTKRFRKVKKKGRTLESHTVHIPLVLLLRWTVRDGVIWRHVPNGEERELRVAAKLKAMGVLPGSADLDFFWRDESDRLRILFLELKLPRGVPSDAQRAFGERAQAIGAEYLVATSVDQALAILRERGLLRADRPITGTASRATES